MAKGKIIYAPPAFNSLVLAGTDYASLASDAFNFGTQNFAVDLLLKITDWSGGANPLLVSKFTLGETDFNGWNFFLDQTTKSLIVGFGLGTPWDSSYFFFPPNILPADGVYFWLRVEFDRTAGKITVRIDGLAVGSADISAFAGSISTDADFVVAGALYGWDNFRGEISLLRIDVGRLLKPACLVQEWDRLRYGCPRKPHDFLAVWTFANTLKDLSANAYELLWQGGGQPVYGTGWPAGLLEYPFDYNFDFGHEVGYLDLDDRMRMFDASDFTYPHPNQKKTYLMDFKNILPEQQAAFHAAWAGKQPIGLFLDADQPCSSLVKLKSFPLQKSVFTNRVDAQFDAEEV